MGYVVHVYTTDYNIKKNQSVSIALKLTRGEVCNVPVHVYHGILDEKIINLLKFLQIIFNRLTFENHLSKARFKMMLLISRRTPRSAYTSYFPSWLDVMQ